MTENITEGTSVPWVTGSLRFFYNFYSVNTHSAQATMSDADYVQCSATIINAQDTFITPKGNQYPGSSGAPGSQLYLSLWICLYQTAQM